MTRAELENNIKIQQSLVEGCTQVIEHLEQEINEKFIWPELAKKYVGTYWKLKNSKFVLEHEYWDEYYYIQSADEDNLHCICFLKDAKGKIEIQKYNESDFLFRSENMKQIDQNDFIKAWSENIIQNVNLISHDIFYPKG